MGQAMQSSLSALVSRLEKGAVRREDSEDKNDDMGTKEGKEVTSSTASTASLYEPIPEVWGSRKLVIVNRIVVVVVFVVILL